MDSRGKRKLSPPSLLNLPMLADTFRSERGLREVPCSPKGLKSPKIRIPKAERSHRGCHPTCMICLDDLITFDAEPATAASNFKQGSYCLRPIVATKCGHAFHTECINKWFMQNKEKEFKTCPTCRKEMRSNDTHRLFFVFAEE